MNNHKDLNFINRDDFFQFQMYVEYVNRFFLDPFSWQFINTFVCKVNSKARHTLKANQSLYRARLNINKGRKEITGKDMGPNPKKIFDGRAHPVGIDVLYLANDEKTALYEMRPVLSDMAYVGMFKSKTDLKIADFRKIYEVVSLEEFREIYQKTNPSDEEKDIIIFSQISGQFSRPIVKEKFEGDAYTSTQMISMALKKAGYDGFIYKSSQNKKGHNYCFFYPKKFEYVQNSVKVYNIMSIDYDYKLDAFDHFEEFIKEKSGQNFPKIDKLIKTSGDHLKRDAQ